MAVANGGSILIPRTIPACRSRAGHRARRAIPRCGHRIRPPRKSRTGRIRSRGLPGFNGAAASLPRKFPFFWLPEDRIAAAWPVACGQRLAERTRIMGFADGVLSVEVTDSAWLQQMRSLSEKLKAELRSIAGVGVTDILFTLPSTSAERHRAKL